MNEPFQQTAPNIDLRDIQAKLQRRKKPALIIGSTVAAIGLLLALFLPPTYSSWSTILIEQQEIPQDMVRSTVTSYADQRIQSITQRTMTYSNLTTIIKKFDLYSDERAAQPLEKIIRLMQENIKTKVNTAEVVDPRSGRPTLATISFTIAYQNPSPLTAQLVANELTSLFLNENLKTRKEMSNLTVEFLAQSAEDERKKTEDLEQKISTFKHEHARELPEYTQLNISSLERTETEYRDARGRLDALQERHIYLTGELARLGASRIMAAGDINGLTPEEKLQYLFNQSLQLKAQYGDDHPDVIRVNRAIDELLAQGVSIQDKSFVTEMTRRKLSERNQLIAKYSASHPDVVKIDTALQALKKIEPKSNSGARNNANNPDYIQLAAQLQSVDASIESAKTQLAQLTEKITGLQKSLSESPTVEQDYRALLRDLETATRNYKEFDAKQTQAKLANALEQEQKGEKFTLIEPPLAPVDPIKPNRTLVAVAGLMLGLAAAIGVTFLMDFFDTSVRGPRSLSQITGSAPFAVVPYIYLASELRAQTGRKWSIWIGAIIAVLILVTIVHFAFRPLDVLMYSLLRKLGL